MGLFSKKLSPYDIGMLEGATDNHSHILFGVDDGISTAEESLATLDLLEKAGLKKLWLTPHTMEDVPNTTEGLKKRFEELKALYHGSIELHLASEYMMDENFEKHLAEDDLLLHGGKNVLVETSTWSGPYNFWEVLEEMMHKGYRPILAHPERYVYMGDKEYARLHDMGVHLQLNYPSVLGTYGEAVQKKAIKLLEKGMYMMLGSDCHRLRAIDNQLQAKVLKKGIAAQMKSIAKDPE